MTTNYISLTFELINHLELGREKNTNRNIKILKTVLLKKININKREMSTPEMTDVIRI